MRWTNEETWYTSSQDISVLHSIQSSLGPKQPPVQWAPGTLLLTINQPRYEAHNSPPSSAQIMNMCHFTSSPHVSMAWCLIKHTNMNTMCS